MALTICNQCANPPECKAVGSCFYHPSEQRVDGLVERDSVTSQRGCPDCGAVVECRVVDVGYHFRMSGYQFRKGPAHARTCRNWTAEEPA